MIDLYQSVENGQQVADILQSILTQGLLPSPIQMVIQMLWFEIFSGSVISLLATLIVRVIRPRQTSGIR